MRQLKRFKQSGQAMVLYALLIPVLFLFVGVGIDLGWYFINVSRLQNAADAAVIAGATKLIEENPEQKLTGYSKNVQLIDSFYGDNETGTTLTRRPATKKL